MTTFSNIRHRIQNSKTKTKTKSRTSCHLKRSIGHPLNLSPFLFLILYPADSRRSPSRAPSVGRAFSVPPLPSPSDSRAFSVPPRDIRAASVSPYDPYTSEYERPDEFARELSPTPVKYGRWGPRASEVAYDKDGNFCCEIFGF